MSSEAESYVNVIEDFVIEEIKLQLAKNELHHKMADYINISEVATFALNRLPCFYASCLEGVEKQKHRIKHDRQLPHQIRQVVNQALLAVQRDPLRKSTPLPQEKQYNLADAKESLPAFNNSLLKQEVEWIISFIETFLTNLKNEQVNQEEIIKLYYLLYYYWQDNP